MTRDLDSLLRTADPARDIHLDEALLTRMRQRVDAERTAPAALHRKRSAWPRRVTLIAAAAATLTAVPLALSALGGVGGGGGGSLLPLAVATSGSITGSLTCAGGEVTVVHPEDAATRLLPAQLPSGWSYTTIRARHFPTTAECIPPSVVALRQDANGQVTARIAITGPVDASVDQTKLVDASVPDTIFGHAARRFDVQNSPIGLRRWVWTDGSGRQWTAQTSGMPLAGAREALTAVTITDTQVTWTTEAPGWTVAAQRTGAPYRTPQGATAWTVQLSDGAHVRLLTVDIADTAALPLRATADVGDQLITVAGHPAILEQPRGGEADGGAPGSKPQTPVLIEMAPGTVASSSAIGGDLPAVESMLGSLQQVAADDQRLQTYDTD